MSDEEERYSEEEEEEAEEAEPASESEAASAAEPSAAAEEEEPEEAAEEEPVVEKPKPKPVVEAAPPAEQNEAKSAIEAQKKRHEEDEAEKLKEYEEQRRIQREKEEEELRLLKEKQERRRKEREEEERQMAERKKADEERRKQEEEERKAKIEADKKKKEEEKQKRQAMMAGLGATGSGGANFTIPTKDKSQDKFDKFGNIVRAKAEMGLTKEQMEEKKAAHLAALSAPIDLSGLDIGSLRSKVKELHQRICKLEADRYDLEKRHERQEYDLKELNERQRQINKNKALKKGLDPDEANSRYPPKVAVASKYDRQIDRRSYGDRRELFEFPPKRRTKTLFHGSNRPPTEWGRGENEELENLRKNLEPPKYAEVAPIEGAKPPMEITPSAGVPSSEFVDGDDDGQAVGGEEED